MIKIIEGDITKTDKDIIIQQVNCKGFMGAGLAKTIMQRYNNVKNEYQAFFMEQIKALEKEECLLGMVNYVNVYDGKIVANIFGQVDIRKHRLDNKVYTVKEALIKGIEDVKGKAEMYSLSIAIPTYIGCGLAGGNWTEVKSEIEAVFHDSTVDVVFYHYRG
ncbi:macro domain-containing protein [Lysinibacillus fusiformis]|uniref:macro domain-containing protein n=1 Tax=Lysinibacillus fusiformis TaxID=28031 RepID=UPI003CFFE5CE